MELRQDTIRLVFIPRGEVYKVAFLRHPKIVRVGSQVTIGGC